MYLIEKPQYVNKTISFLSLLAQSVWKIVQELLSGMTFPRIQEPFFRVRVGPIKLTKVGLKEFIANKDSVSIPEPV